MSSYRDLGPTTIPIRIGVLVTSKFCEPDLWRIIAIDRDTFTIERFGKSGDRTRERWIKEEAGHLIHKGFDPSGLLDSEKPSDPEALVKSILLAQGENVENI